LTACGSSARDSDQVRLSKRLAPPVIGEQFTPLPCPRSRAARQTTIGLLGCTEKVILRTDALINARARRIFRLLRDAAGRRLFLAAERAWLFYRRRSCLSVSDIYRGGSASPVVYATCVVDRNRVHLTELAEFERFLHRES
jgi:uncharacterized protein YecT (DUF1311 family)